MGNKPKVPHARDAKERKGGDTNCTNWHEELKATETLKALIANQSGRRPDLTARITRAQS
jgi:hypothetical protein